MTNSEKLAAVGHALYGDQWQGPIARDLEVALRTVQRWISGERDCPDLSTELIKLITARQEELTQLLARLKAR